MIASDWLIRDLAIFQERKEALRVQGAVALLPLLALEQVHVDRLVGEALEIERDPHAVRRATPEVGVEPHGSLSFPARPTSRAPWQATARQDQRLGQDRRVADMVGENQDEAGVHQLARLVREPLVRGDEGGIEAVGVAQVGRPDQAAHRASSHPSARSTAAFERLRLDPSKPGAQMLVRPHEVGRAGPGVVALLEQARLVDEVAADAEQLARARAGRRAARHRSRSG